MIRIVFLLVASLGVLAALGTVLARNLVHAALYLVAFFFLIACQFVLLEAEFLAAIQVLVYIGAVAILILFGIMLTRNIQGDETTGGGPLRLIPGALVAAALLALLVVGIRGESGLGDRPGWAAIRARPDLDSGPAADPARAEALQGMAPGVGAEMMTRYVVAFEVAGLLLTAAVVGAVALAIGRRGPEHPGFDHTANDEPVPVEGDGAPTESVGPPSNVPNRPASAPR